MKYKINIKKTDDEFSSNINRLNGKVYIFIDGWKLDFKETKSHPREKAMIAHDINYPKDCPKWLPSGCLEEAN